MKSLWFTFLISTPLLLAACGETPVDQRAYLEQDGAWGWDNGAGCEGLANAWVITDNIIDMFSDGEIVDRGQLEERRLLNRDFQTVGDGPLEYVEWIFIGHALDNPDETGRYEMMFAVRGGFGQPTALVPRRYRDFRPEGEGETRQLEEPFIENRIVPCSAMEER